MKAIRVAATVLLATVVAGCDPEYSVVWEQHVPSPAAEAIENQEILARGPNTITLMPISPRGAIVGVAYSYDMPHCGIASPIDIDGSFWDPLVPPADPTQFDMQSGTFRLLSPNEAVFTILGGDRLELTRHAGAKAFGLCD